MIKPGYIRLIDGKVKFEYYELEKPDSYTYERARDFNFDCSYYQNEIKEYEASKRTIEVSNEIYPVTIMLDKKWILLKKDWKIVKGNETCEAEVTDKATIVELTK